MELYIVDAFTDRRFAGNPAAVCFLDGDRDSRWMQNVAAEMNLSETAFVRPQGSGYALRWFTPTVEVDLCGHATLASAHAMWSEGVVRGGAPIAFHTKSGVLTCTRGDGLIYLDFPATPAERREVSVEVLSALGISAPVFAGETQHDTLLVVATEDHVRAITPDFPRLRGCVRRGVMVTAQANDPGYDFISRFFAPRAGINEDPVTGSAHCCLGPYWGARLGKDTLTACQVSARGGTVRMRLDGTRVHLGGSAVTVLRGKLTVTQAAPRRFFDQMVEVCAEVK